MNYENYQLPEYTIIAGETQNITILLFNQDDMQLDADGMVARLAISDFVNRGDNPLVIKNCTVVIPPVSDVSSLYCHLSPSDTLSLRGKYIYQVTVRDVEGVTTILRGIMNIIGNVDQNAVSIT